MNKINQKKAQEAYDLLCEAEEICVNGMDDVYGAWYFGIYDADEYYEYNVFNKLSLEVSFSESELQTNGGFQASSLIEGLGSVSEWQICVWTIMNCMTARGDYERLDNLLAESKSKIQTIPEGYKYLEDFKDYYTKVSSYAEFFKNPSGSFNQLSDTIADYENGIRTAKESFKFDFE